MVFKCHLKRFCLLCCESTVGDKRFWMFDRSDGRFGCALACTTRSSLTGCECFRWNKSWWYGTKTTLQSRARSSTISANFWASVSSPLSPVYYCNAAKLLSCGYKIMWQISAVTDKWLFFWLLLSHSTIPDQRPRTGRTAGAGDGTQAQVIADKDVIDDEGDAQGVSS